MIRARLSRWAVGLFCVMVLTACSDGADQTEQKAAPPVDPDSLQALQNEREAKRAEAQGKELYEMVCASCHEGQVAKAPHRTMLEIMSPESIYESMVSGVMKENAAGLRQDEKVILSEYLAGKKIGGGDDVSQLMCETPPEEAFDYSRPPFAPGWGLNRNNQRLIDTDTAGLSPEDLPKLELKWAFAYPDALRARSAPMVAAGMIFVGSHNGTVFALDQKTGCVYWTFRASAEVRTGIVMSPWEAGDDSTQPMAFFGDLLGNVYGINAVTGELAWRARADDHPNATITGTPSLYNGKLHVPVSSLEVAPAADPNYECCTFRGSVKTFDAATGDVLWQAFTIESPPTVQGQNRAGTDQYGPSGAPIWNSPAIDTRRNQLYVGTGENYSSPASLTSDAIFAIDLDTGKVNWSFQATPNDAWNMACDIEDNHNCPEEDGPDFDFGAATLLATDANGRDLVLGGQKSGVVHALDPETGEVVWQTKVGRGGIQGGVHFGMANSGNRLFVPISDMPDGRTYPEERRPGLYALDLTDGSYLWKQPAPTDVCGERQFCHPGISAAITTTPEMVLAGAMDGVLRIHDTESGELLWQYDTAKTYETLSGVEADGGSIGGAAGPIMVDGMLYVNSGYGIYFHMPGHVLLAFGLPEEAEVSDDASE